MALVDFAPVARPSAGNAVSAAVRSVRNWIAEQHTQSVRRAALRDLMQMPSHRLDDLGISAFDVQRALQRGPSSRG